MKKTQIVENDGYELFLNTFKTIDGYNGIRFTSTYNKSKNPTSEHNKFEFYLNDSDYDKFVKALQK